MSCLSCISRNCKPYGFSLQDDPKSLCSCWCHGQGQDAEAEREEAESKDGAEEWDTHDDTCECDNCCDPEVDAEKDV